MSDERREDWHRGVDENLASLNAGQRVWEREMAVIRRLLGEFDHLLRGDPEKDTDGAMARLHIQENDINLLKALVLKDAAGNKGLVGRVETLESGERTSDNRWKFATAVVVAVLSMAGLLITNWDRIGAFLTQKPTDKLDRMIEKAKHPKGRHPRVVYREEADPNEESPQN